MILIVSSNIGTGTRKKTRSQPIANPTAEHVDILIKRPPGKQHLWGWTQPQHLFQKNVKHISSSTGLTLEFIAAQWFTRCMLLHVCFIGGCYWPNNKPMRSANKHQGLPHASSAEELVASISTGCQVSCWLMLAPAMFFRIASQPEN